MTESRDRAEVAARLTCDEALRAARQSIDAALRLSPPVLRPYTAHLAGAQGKLLRAAALIACAQNEDGTVHPDAVPFAAAIELLHLGTLVHDDVIDDADTRRGIPTLQRRWGRRTAVLCGDYLLSAALRLAASAEDRERYLSLCLPDYMGRVCAGELLQQENSGNLDLTVGRYLRIIRGKTAALFEAAYRAGATLCTDDSAEVLRYARVGRWVGMIFQLTDDCIDYDHDAATAQKPVLSDYEQGVVTLPLIRALAQFPDLKCRARREALGRTEVSRAVCAAGGTEYTRWFARRYYDRATAALEALDLSAEKEARLTSILEKAYLGPGKPALSVPATH